MKIESGFLANLHRLWNPINTRPIRSAGQTGARMAPLFVAVLVMAGCAVGPNFKRPPPPVTTNYVAVPLTSTTSTTNLAGGEAQRFVAGLDIPGQWWSLFHSDPLNELIKRALTNNPDLKAAQEALVVAQENLRAQRGVFYPNISGSFAASRQRQSGFLAPTPNANVFQYNLFTPQVSVSYVPDVFGLNRRTVESSQAQEQSVRFQMVDLSNSQRQCGRGGRSGSLLARAD